MKQRSPVAAALLSFFIPFYALYWLWATGKEMRNRGGKAPSIAFLFAPLLLMPIALVAGSLLAPNSDGAGAILLLLAVFIGIPLSIIYYFRFCKAAEQVTNGHVSAGLAIVLMLVISPVAIFIIQEKLNETASGMPPAGSTPDPFAGSPTPPAQPTESPVASPTVASEAPVPSNESTFAPPAAAAPEAEVDTASAPLVDTPAPAPAPEQEDTPPTIQMPPQA